MLGSCAQRGLSAVHNGERSAAVSGTATASEAAALAKRPAMGLGSPASLLVEPERPPPLPLVVMARTGRPQACNTGFITPHAASFVACMDSTAENTIASQS